tara:strand:+ start:402 stop:1289 length:888 start_codon:yes stop_codon:yes gene_type:complete
MTAIKKYSRLESSGLWKESEKSEFTDVLIAFGKTSIILSDYKDNPITHWSLAAIKLVSHNQNEAIFSTDLDTGERLSIKDAQMIESLLLFIQKDEEKSKKSKIFLYLGTLSLFIFSVTFVLYFPSKIRDLTVSIISAEHEIQLIKPFLQTHIKSSGGVCESPETNKIVSEILNFFKKDRQYLSILIIKNQNINILHLPGGILLISNNFLKNAPSEKGLTTLLENEILQAISREPLKTLINQQTTYRLIQFILGFKATLPLKAINEFLRPSPIPNNNKNYGLDDFSWVALQNACLN